MSFLVAALLMGALTVARAQTTEVAGVKYENNLQAGNTPLVLNGAGVRYKAIFKVYTAGLYMTKKANTTEAVLEVHLVDFAGDLYGRELEVCFLEFLRPETKFAGPAQLRAQIERDVAAARAKLRA